MTILELFVYQFEVIIFAYISRWIPGGGGGGGRRKVFVIYKTSYEHISAQLVKSLLAFCQKLINMWVWV